MMMNRSVLNNYIAMVNADEELLLKDVNYSAFSVTVITAPCIRLRQSVNVAAPQLKALPKQIHYNSNEQLKG
jgi:hypothetical protein